MDRPLAGPFLLTSSHFIRQFDCSVPSLNTYLSKEALKNQQSPGGARTYVVENYVLGYFTLAYGSATDTDTDVDVDEDVDVSSPLMLLVKLAVDKREHRKGLGKALLKHALLKSLNAAKVTGLSAVVIYAKDASARMFFQKFGFMLTPFDDFYMYLSIKDIANNLKN